MTSPILTTKLYIPAPLGSLVARPQLVERLNEGLARPLTLVAEPAGFGKTTTSPATTPSTQCPRRYARREPRWRFDLIASWSGSTTGAAWSRSILAPSTRLLLSGASGLTRTRAHPRSASRHAED